MKFKLSKTILILLIAFCLFVFVKSVSVNSEILPYRDSPRDVVIQMFTKEAIASDIYNKTKTPDFTLYGNGKVIYTRYLPDQTCQLMEAKMSPKYIEFLLNFFEQEGFFDMNDNYLNLTIKDLPTTYITVNLRDKKRTITVYGLTLALKQRMLPKGLVNIHRKLNEFAREDEKEYIPKKISLYVHGVTPGMMPKDSIIVKWKVKKIDLRKYINKKDSLIIRYKQTILTGDDKKNIMNFLGRKTLYKNRYGFMDTFFKNHKRYFKVAYRPHLPYE
ncbi:MAG: hypothetical protein K8T10_08735 [Candidatus Eremiobacteraeota bacterium]|nr:hypothetical protein [Candidatus Eremiobacteraeota bacterium]